MTYEESKIYIEKILPRKMYYNLRGIEQFSFWGDIKVMFMTVFAVLGKEYKESYDEAYIKELLQGLSALGAKIAVLTGVGFKEGKTGVMGYDSANDEYFYFEQDKLPCAYHGTGDIFSSTCMGAMMCGLDWKKALTVAARYTAECIRVTFETPGSNTYGVDFERVVPYLLELLSENN